MQKYHVINNDKNEFLDKNDLPFFILKKTAVLQAMHFAIVGD